MEQPANGDTDEVPNTVPRDYQIDILRKALERNIIVWLATGTGKTFISVLLIKELLHQTQPAGGNKRTVFLAPTVPLIKQQAAVIKKHIETKIGCYSGGEPVDNWDQYQWQREIEDNNVLVMVPQLLSDILNQNYVSLERINLIIFDECHAATGNSCYVQIMQNHYIPTNSSRRPKILGLTASVLNKKVQPSRIETDIRDLCARLDSTLATSPNADKFGTRPNEFVIRYLENGDVNSFANMASPPVGLFSIQIKNLLVDVGPYGALKSLEHRRQCTQHLLDVGLAEKSRLENLRSLMQEIDIAYATVKKHFDRIRQKTIKNPYKVLVQQPTSTDELDISVPPKAERLIEILETLKNLGRDLCCVVFAQERYTVFALWCLLTTLSRKCRERFGFIRPGFVMGGQNSSFKSEKEKILDFADERFADEGSTLDNFRKGTLNLLVATSVIEEGVDVPQCNLVVKMGESMNLKSYVQCRGRARAKPAIYAILTSEEKGPKVVEDIKKFKYAEEVIARYCKEHDMDVMSDAEVELALLDDPDLPTLYANPDSPSNSAIITAQSARGVLQRYCDTLSRDRYQVQRAQFTEISRPSVAVNKEDRMCSILVPEASKLFPEVVHGKWLSTKVKARVSACLETCKRLYELDELTENLVPRKRPKANAYVWTDDQVSDEVKRLFEGNTIQQKSSIHTKRATSRELTPSPHPVLPAIATVYAFRLRLDVPLNDEHSHMRTFRPEEEDLCFGILTFASNCSTNIPDFPIFTRNGTEIVQIETLPDVVVTQDIWEMCTKFHAYLMKIVCRISHSECDPVLAPMYVPVRSRTIDVELLRIIHSEQKQSVNLNSVVSRRIDEKDELRSFFIREILKTGSGPELTLEKIPKNLDYSRNAFVDKTKLKKMTSADRRAEFAIPVVICDVEYLSAPQWSKARTIPICTHRLNRLLIAEQYRKDIAATEARHDELHQWPAMVEDDFSGVWGALPRVTSAELKFIKEVENSAGPSPADLLTALTPQSAQDIVNSERFEVLGDAFLKIAVTLHLFSKKELSDEGLLTRERCRLISNMNLLSLAVPRGLHEAVESRKFSIEESFRPPGVIIPDEDKKRRLQFQNYKSKICADSVEAMIGVYLERSGPIGALKFLRYLGLELGYKESGPFLSRFDLSYDPFVIKDRVSKQDVLRQRSDDISHVERILGYAFRNRLYLLEALTHQSYIYQRITRSYERLEFLGDAVIDYLVSCFIFTNVPHLKPGQMTLVRSALVNNNLFALIMAKTTLNKNLLHHSPRLFQAVSAFTTAIERPNSPGTLIGEDETEDSNWIDVPKPFGDLLESLIGAVFIDSGLNFAVSWEVFRRLITDKVLIDTLKETPRNPIQTLEEKLPGKCKYGDVEILKDKQVKMSLDIGSHQFSTVARNRKMAKQTLAKRALKTLSEEASAANEKLSVMDQLANELVLG